jgi:epsilon-lactone hydrolase
MPKPLAAVVMSPWADVALTGESIEARAESDPMLTRDALNQAAQLYLSDEDRLTQGLPHYMSKSPGYRP